VPVGLLAVAAWSSSVVSSDALLAVISFVAVLAIAAMLAWGFGLGRSGAIALLLTASGVLAFFFEFLDLAAHRPHAPRPKNARVTR